jgi:hypothetical protein
MSESVAVMIDHNPSCGTPGGRPTSLTRGRVKLPHLTR